MSRHSNSLRFKKKDQNLELDLGPEWEGTKITDEIVRKSLDYNSILDYRLRNPDQLLLDVGKNVRLYDEMIQDDAINSAMNIKKRIILSTPYEFRPASDSQDNIVICEFIKRMFDGFKVRFIDCLDNLLDANIYGFKIGEKVWNLEDGKIILKNIKFRHSLLFDFEYDEFANLSVLHVGYYYGGQHMAVRGKDIQNKFTIFVYPYIKDGIYYGSSELKEVYRQWLAKTNIQKWRNNYIQNYGQPIVEIKYNAETVDPAELEGIEEMISNLQDQQYFTNPSTRNMETNELIGKFDLIFHDIAKGSTNTELHERAIDQLDKQIKRKLLIPDKLGFSESVGGSYNQSDTQFDILMSVITFYHGRLEEIVNSDWIKQAVDFNFPNVKEYPKLKFKEINNKLKSDTLQILIQNGVVSADESWIREYMDIPEKEDVIDPNMQEAIDNTIPIQSINQAKQQAYSPANMYQPGFPTQNVPHQPTPGQGRVENVGASSQPVAQGVMSNPSAGNTPNGMVGNVPQAHYETMPANVKRGGINTPYPAGMTPTLVNQKSKMPMWSTYKRSSIKDVYDFEAHKKDLNTNEADFIKEYNKIHCEMAEDLVRQIQKKKIIENKDYAAFKTVQVKKGELKDLLTQYYSKMYLLGKANAIDQISHRLKKVRPQAFTMMYFSIDETSDGIDWLDRTWIDSYLKQYGDLGTLTKADKEYLKNLRNKAFFITGETEARMLKVFQVIDSGLNSGLMARDIISKIETYLSDDRKQYATTIARTNEAESYGTAMMNQYMSDNVRPAIEAFQFSAIIDDTTTDICEGLDGTIIYKDDPDLAQYSPPLHFNCRSVLIPIFIGDEDNEDSYYKDYSTRFEEYDKSLRPAEGFGG